MPFLENVEWNLGTLAGCWIGPLPLWRRLRSSLPMASKANTNNNTSCFNCLSYSSTRVKLLYDYRLYAFGYRNTALVDIRIPSTAFMVLVPRPASYNQANPRHHRMALLRVCVPAYLSDLQSHLCDYNKSDICASGSCSPASTDIGGLSLFPLTLESRRRMSYGLRQCQ